MIKSILFSMLLAALPPWLTGTLTDISGGGCQAEARAALAGKDCKVVALGSDPATTENAEVHAFVIAATEDEKSGNQRKKLKIVTRTKTGDAETQGWLGVAIGSTPEALADQLDIEGRGVMILNVVKDSPAEHAGLKAHDIIMSVGGEEAGDDIGKAVELVGSRKPGDKVEVVVLRQGEEKTIKVELGSRADMDKCVWIHEGDPLAEVEERIVTRGKILRRGPNDEWIFEDLGDLDELSDLSEKIKVLLPKSGSRSVQVFVDGNRESIKTKVEKDGAVIVVAREDEGEITVTRTDKDGEETEATYANEEELAAADPEAYELYESAGESAVIHLDLEGIADIDLDLEELQEDVDEWRGDLREHLEEAGEAYQEALESAHEAIREWLDRWQESDATGGGEPSPHFVAPPMIPGKDPFFASQFLQLGKPRHSFTVKEDGSIEVRIRKGDSELVRVFNNEENLAERNPKLYEKYQELIKAEE